MLRRTGLIVLHALAMLWASPWTLIGLCFGILGLATGGHARRRGRILEFYGGAVTWLLKKLPTGQLTLAMTWGHVVLGQTDASLDIAREHEMVHVRQYERWGEVSRKLLKLEGGLPMGDNRPSQFSSFSRRR